jgi:hypothetical protein
MYVPDELRAYTYDDQAERAAKRLHRILGTITLVLVVVTVTLFCLKRPAFGMGAFVVFFVVCVCYCINYKRKKDVPCWSCGNSMEVLDAAFPEEELGKTDRKWLNRPLLKGDGRSLFVGGDGCVYEVTSPSNTPGYWYLSKYNLRLYVCHKCRGYFRYGNVITEVKSGQSTEEIERLKQELESGR